MYMYFEKKHNILKQTHDKIVVKEYKTRIKKRRKIINFPNSSLVQFSLPKLLF